jgi:hypothetical protein
MGAFSVSEHHCPIRLNITEDKMILKQKILLVDFEYLFLNPDLEKKTIGI